MKESKNITFTASKSENGQVHVTDPSIGPNEKFRTRTCAYSPKELTSSSTIAQQANAAVNAMRMKTPVTYKKPFKIQIFVPQGTEIKSFKAEVLKLL